MKDSEKNNHTNHKPFSPFELIIKRSIDIIGGLIGTLCFALIFIALVPFYIFSPKKDKGPILYTQKRYGKNGKPFKIIKFRTMIVNSDQYWDSHPDVYLLYKKNGNKLANDPRVTKIGKFIRNKSLDEFPQFINVLLGQMSLVGPRPILEFEIPEYGHHIHKLWFSKPGITGHWTTHGRSKILFPERAELELMYNKHHGLIYDIKCLGLTIIQTINGEDAY